MKDKTMRVYHMAVNRTHYLGSLKIDLSIQHIA